MKNFSLETAHKHKLILKQIDKWCKENDVKYSVINDWIFNVKFKKESLNINPITTSWLNNLSGERGRYRDLIEFLNFKLIKNG